MTRQTRLSPPQSSGQAAARITVFASLIVCTPTAWAATREGASSEPASPWRLGAEIELEYESERNFNLDSGDDENEAVFAPQLNLDASYRPSPKLQGFVRLEWTREYGVSGPEADTGAARLDLAEAYLASEEIALPAGGELALYLGRRLFRDERQWLQDEQLDGLTIRYDYNAWSLSLSATRQRDKDLLNHNDVDKTDNLYAYGQYDFQDRVLGAYLLKRREREGGEGRPLFIGIRSYGEIVNTTDYWLEMAVVRGHDGADSIRGWGFDSGIVYHFDAPLSPSLILGYAIGSGDNNPEDGVDHAFRQTGLQDNEHEQGGLMDFPYLGVTLEPELSNLSVLTTGIGFLPHERISIQLLYHQYRQQHASDTLRDSNLDADPNGVDQDLGYGVDLAIGAELTDTIEIEALAGLFQPGDAFEDDSDSALFFGTKFEYKF